MKEKEDEDFCGRCHGGAKEAVNLNTWSPKIPVKVCAAELLLLCWKEEWGDKFVSGRATECGLHSFYQAADLPGSACPLPALGWNNTILAPTSANVTEVIKHNSHSKAKYPIPSDLDARKTKVAKKTSLLSGVTPHSQSLL